MNYQKSTITFGKCVYSTLQNTIKQFTGIRKIGGLGKYLGLPEYIGKNRYDTFSYLAQRIQHKMENWYSKLLSPAGKEVLLKAVVTAIPTYAMSCFLLPYRLVDRVTQTMRRFWWSSDPTKNKMAWVAWDKITNSKNDGGLGIRNLMDFNIALLAKQGWRLLKYPNSLVAKVFKAKYYNKSSFLEAVQPRQCSYVWRSILHSQSLLS